MYKTLNGAIIVLGLAGAGLMATGPAIADDIGVGVHVGGVGIGVGVGNIAYGYQDGYWDRDHAWHPWRNAEELREYRNQPGNQYSDWRHDRDPDQGWRTIAFVPGDVAFGYQDGYWDRGHQWHRWQNDGELAQYRSSAGNHYYDWRHDRDADQGWRGLAFNVGDVAIGYNDGYWDRAHQWHEWRNEQDMRDYRSAPGNRYNDWRHDRDGGDGWHS